MRSFAPHPPKLLIQLDATPFGRRDRLSFLRGCQETPARAIPTVVYGVKDTTRQQFPCSCWLNLWQAHGIRHAGSGECNWLGRPGNFSGLNFRPPPACFPCLILGAEPPLAFGGADGCLPVVPLPRYVIDAFARVDADVAFDGTGEVFGSEGHSRPYPGKHQHAEDRRN